MAAQLEPASATIQLKLGEILDEKGDVEGAVKAVEAALKIDAGNAGAISLWLAANLRREISMPQGMTDASRSAGSQDAAFYAMAAGPGTMNPVLARALDNQDSALALRAITALEATGGVSGLVADAGSPLVRAARAG